MYIEKNVPVPAENPRRGDTFYRLGLDAMEVGDSFIVYLSGTRNFDTFGVHPPEDQTIRLCAKRRGWKMQAKSDYSDKGLTKRYWRIA